MLVTLEGHEHCPHTVLLQSHIYDTMMRRRSYVRGRAQRFCDRCKCHVHKGAVTRSSTTRTQHLFAVAAWPDFLFTPHKTSQKQKELYTIAC